MSALPSVSLIVVNWNARPFLEKCLRSLQSLDYPDYSLVVVDNGSTDDSVAFLQQAFPEVNIHCTAANRGFAAGCNAGLHLTHSEVAVVMNPDVEVATDWLRELVSPMVEDPRVGVSGCKLIYPDGRGIQHAGGYITYPRGVPGHYGLNEEDHGQYDAPRDVDYVIGAAMAIRREMLDRIGGFDEGYFLYYEDVDLCVRARNAGYRVVYAPQSSAIHAESVTTVKGSPFYLEHMHGSRWRFLLKHYAVDDLLNDTFPAERVWLEHCPPAELRAAAHAYRSAMQELADIWAAHPPGSPESNGRASMDDQRSSVALGLRKLRQTSWRMLELPPAPDASSEQERRRMLHSAWQIEERPFVSRTPVVGRLIARFRESWNNVSTKWYVRPILEQQVGFNLQVAEELNALGNLLAEHDSRLVSADQDATAHAHDLAELSALVIQLGQRIVDLEQRLEQLEAGSSPGQEDR